MPRISSVVGRSAPNQQHDVAVIQAALANLPANQGFGGPSLWTRPVDGRPSPDLEAAIAAFQTKERLPVTHRVEASGPGLDAMERALPHEMRGLTGIEGTDVVVLNGYQPHGFQEAARILRERTLLPRDAADALARLAETVHRASGLVLRPDGHGITANGALVQCLAFADVRWVGRDGKPAFSPPPDRVDAAVRAVQRHGLGGGLEWVQGPPSSAVSGPISPPTQSQRVGRDMPGPQGGPMRLAVRTRACLTCLAGQTGGIDRVRLARLNLQATNDPVVERLLDAAAAEVEAGDGTRGASGSASQSGTSEAEMILDLVTGTNDQATNNLRQAQRQITARSQPSSGHHGEAPDMFPSGKNPFEEAVADLLDEFNKNVRSSDHLVMTMALRTIATRAVALRRFIGLVGSRKPWDIKHAYPIWIIDLDTRLEFGRNMWVNIHYGFIGRSIGFSRTLLETGAVLNQLHNLGVRHDSPLELIEGLFENQLGTFDDPKDLAAIRLGMDLMDQCRTGIPTSALSRTIRQRSSQLNSRPGR